MVDHISGTGLILLLVIAGPIVGYVLGRVFGKAVSAPLADGAKELQKIIDMKAAKDAKGLHDDLLSRTQDGPK